MDSSGAVDGLAQLRASGFDLNAFVCAKGHADYVYSITSVEGVGSSAKVSVENTVSQEVKKLSLIHI